MGPLPADLAPKRLVVDTSVLVRFVQRGETTKGFFITHLLPHMVIPEIVHQEISSLSRQGRSNDVRRAASELLEMINDGQFGDPLHLIDWEPGLFNEMQERLWRSRRHRSVDIPQNLSPDSGESAVAAIALHNKLWIVCDDGSTGIALRKIARDSDKEYSWILYELDSRPILSSQYLIKSWVISGGDPLEAWQTYSELIPPGNSPKKKSLSLEAFVIDTITDCLDQKLMNSLRTPPEHPYRLARAKSWGFLRDKGGVQLDSDLINNLTREEQVGLALEMTRLISGAVTDLVSLEKYRENTFLMSFTSIDGSTKGFVALLLQNDYLGVLGVHLHGEYLGELINTHPSTQELLPTKALRISGVPTAIQPIATHSQTPD